MQMRRFTNEANGPWPSFPYELERPCMNCDLKVGHWERVWTGDLDSREGFEDWYCCHACRDAGLSCETFHKIAEPETAPA